MDLVITALVAHKIWYKDNRRISCDDVQRAWRIYVESDPQLHAAIYDLREDHDPPLQWILVKINRRLMKLVFATYEDEDPDESSAYLVTAYYVDHKTRLTYEAEGGFVYG